jgi:hypothetical protein
MCKAMKKKMRIINSIAFLTKCFIFLQSLYSSEALAQLDTFHITLCEEFQRDEILGLRIETEGRSVELSRYGISSYAHPLMDVSRCDTTLVLVVELSKYILKFHNLRDYLKSPYFEICCVNKKKHRRNKDYWFIYENRLGGAFFGRFRTVGRDIKNKLILSNEALPTGTGVTPVRY